MTPTAARSSASPPRAAPHAASLATAGPTAAGSRDAPNPDGAARPAPATRAPTLGLVLFGRDAAGKRRAARFPAEKAEAAERAAALMGLQVWRLTDPEQAARAAALPLGRLFASGRGLVPLVQGKVLDAVFTGPAPADTAPTEPQPGAPVASRAAITLGSLVLVGEVYPLCGWYEAVVVGDPGGDLFTLRWRDWPDDPPVVRKREDLGLLPPGSLIAAGVIAAEDHRDGEGVDER